MNSREVGLRFASVVGALVGYGSLAAFFYLVAWQSYRWLRDGEWTHIELVNGLHDKLASCCVKDGDAGRMASFVHWLDTPTSWLGMHKVFEIVPASLALFALSILGNWLFVYCTDRLSARSAR
jgi:hypothetical protein